MFNWKIYHDVYFSWLHTIYEKIHRELVVLINRKNDDTWNEKIISWINQPAHIHWLIFSFLFLILIVVGIVIKYRFSALPLNLDNSIPHEDNEDVQTCMEYSGFIPKSSDISRVIKANKILHFDTENYKQFYIVSLGINQTGNSSLEINEIFDTTAIPDDDEMQRVEEFKNILDEIVDNIETQSKKFQSNVTELVDSHLESRPCKISSKIPLLRSRQRKVTDEDSENFP